MKVLITGGAGFIGHNVAVFLKGLGFEVIVFDNLERASQQALNKLAINDIPVVKGSILNSRLFKKTLPQVDVVIHAAAYISIEESIRKPTKYFTNNVVGTVNVTNFCLEQNVNFMIYLSSAAVYGEPKVLPISEDHPTNPISPYGLSKLMGERIVTFYGQQGLNYTILRIFNVYGPGQTGDYAGVIMRFIKSIRRGKPPVIYGDGHQTRDFIHVNDVAEAIKRVIEGRPVGEIINIAAGKPVVIKDLANLVIKLAGANLKPIYGKQRRGDIKHIYADTTRAQKLLSFKPKITLEEGLKELIASHT